MKAACISCAHFDSSNAPAMSKHGFGQCLLILGNPQPTGNHLGRYISISRPYGCEQHKEADADIVAKRVEWNQKRRGG